MKKILMSAVAICVMAFSLGAALAANPEPSIDELKQHYKRPTTIPFPEGSPYSLHMATLGKMLFYDPRLSGAQNMSCASCHNPSFGYEVPVATAIGAANTPLGRHAPTTLNLAWGQSFFWDGRAGSLEEQAAGPITAEVEMNGKFPEIIRRLSSVSEYQTWFARLFPQEGVSKNAILTSIATYERTIVSELAPFDSWVNGDENAISASAKRGFALFTGKAKCAACHTGWNFTDDKFHDIGLASHDPGRRDYEPHNAMANHAFKTPGLRNVTYRAPFMHDGSIADLDAVIDHYVSGGAERPSKSEKMQSVTLTPSEREDLLAFLFTLTAEKTVTPLPLLPN